MSAGALTTWACALLDALAAAGVRDVVVSPGSRSTPFVLAAARRPDLRLHDVLDERAAAFFALGQARVTGRPSLLLCTSGTAGAHYLPAVIEAAQAFVPVVILTADRPFELQGCGAPQTIDQLKLYGGFPRLFVELGLPDASPAALAGVRRAAAQAVAAALGPVPGPVHLNARARKPLEPARAEDLPPPAPAPVTRVHAPTSPPPDPAVVDALLDVCLAARRGVMVAGPAPVTQADARRDVAALARTLGLPLLAEAPSQLRFGRPDGTPACDAFDLVLSTSGEAELVPDFILQLGAAPTSRSWERLLDRVPDLPRWVVAPHGWSDPQGTATALVRADVGATARALAARLAERGVRGERGAWTARLVEADARAWRAVDAELAAGDDDDLTEGHVARAAVASVPEGGLLAVGNSLPIRLVDAFVPAGAATAPVLSQRGANGIDGLVAGAAGAAVASGRPVTLLLGDVSLLHDVGGLLLARRATAPLVIVTIHNDGGRIFEALPVARVPGFPAGTLEHFTTPHGLDLAPAAALYGLRHARARGRAALAAALAEAQAIPGATLIEARVPPDGAREQLARVRARLEETRP